MRKVKLIEDDYPLVRKRTKKKKYLYNLYKVTIIPKWVRDAFGGNFYVPGENKKEAEEFARDIIHDRRILGIDAEYLVKAALEKITEQVRNDIVHNGGSYKGLLVHSNVELGEEK